MKQDPKQINKGMYISTIPEEQPPGTYPFMLNAVKSREGATHREREKSTQLKCPLNPGQWVVGAHRLREDLTVFLIYDPQNKHQILDQNCNILYESECLGFTNNNYLSIQHRTIRGCNDILYITGLNYEPRRVNLSNLDLINDCSDIKLIPDYDTACIRTELITGGGLFNPGSYNVAIQYLTDDLAETPWMLDTNTIYIGTGFSQNVDPTNGQPPAAASIEVTVTGADPDFAYYRLALIEANAGTGVVSDIVTTAPIPINQTRYTLTGQPTGGERISIEQILQDKIEFRGAEHAVQSEGRLVLSNIQLADYDQCNWQKYASKIGTTVKIVKTPKSDVKDKKFFMGDEVYAYFIQYLMPTGWTSNMFHIPGPSPGKYRCEKITDSGGGGGTEIRTRYCLKLRVFTVDRCRSTFGDITVRFRIVKSDNSYHPNPQGGNTWELTLPFNASASGYTDIEVFCTIDFEIKGFQFDPVEGQGWTTTIDPFECKIAEIFMFKTEEQVIFNHGGGTTFTFMDHVDFEVPLQWSTDMQHIIPDRETFELVIGKCPECANGTFTKECRDALYEKADEIGLPRRWQIENTAVAIDSTSYRPGYYACRSALYEPKSCVEDFWGQDECGEDLVGTPLRFTRMPSRRQVPVEDGDFINTFEVQFDNIEYPHPDIIGHRILYAKRTSENKTIFDKGMLTTLWTKQLISGDTLIGNQGTAPFVRNEGSGREWAQFISPKTQFYQQQPIGNHYRLEEFRGQDIPNNPGRWEADDWSLVESSFLREANAYIFAGTIRMATSAVPDDQNVAVERSWMLSPTSYTDYEGDTLTNYSLTTHHAYSKLLSPYMLHDQNVFSVHYASTRIQRDVYCQINTLIGIPAHDCWLSLAQPTIVSEGDTFISEFVIASLFACVDGDVIRDDEYAAGYGLAAPSLASNSGTFPFTFSNNYGIFAIDAIDAISKPSTRLGAFFNNREPVATGEAIINFWVESDINTARRHSTASEQYYDKTRLLPHFRDQILVNEDGELGSGKDWILLDSPHKEAYLYNKDFSRLREEKIALPLPFTYDCCSSCPEYFPTRRWWSDKGNQEQLTDRYRYFRANNYNDIEAEFGAITASWKVRNNLIFQTAERMYIQPLNVQQQVSDLTLTIGTGEFMSLDPQIALTKGGGTIDRRSVVMTPVGVFFADRVTRTFWVYTDRLTPLPGMEPFFDDELDTKRTSDFTDTIIGGYDPYNERVIWTKIQMNGDADVSWTISFDTQEMVWVSMHSYKPRAYAYGENTLYLADNAGIHHMLTTEGDYNNYFGVQSPFVVDTILTSPMDARVWNYVEFYAYSKIYDQYGNAVDADEIFSHMIAWTSYQITGELELINSLTAKQEENWMLDTIRDNNRTADISRVARGWSVNALRNILTSTSVPMFFTNRRDPLLQNAYYVDRVLNEAAIDYNKPWINRDYLHDTFLRLRLIQKSKRAVQLVVNYLIGDASDQNL